LFDRTREDRKGFAMDLMQYLRADKKAARFLPFIAAKTLGRHLGSAHLAALWGLLMTYPQHASEDMARAGYKLSPLAGDELFEKLLDYPEGIMIAKLNPNANLERLRTAEKKIHLHIEELDEWMAEIAPEKERAALENIALPFVLVAGRHFPHTANTIMRDPAWNDHKPVCTLLIHAEDAQALGLEDGEDAWLSTETSRVKVPVEVSDIPSKGAVVLPHGFGLVYEGEEQGVNVNVLTKNSHRDRIAGTPLHRYVPCRVEATRR
jgi:anaerobic selenocysteine-containing dehydrogenase